MILYYQDEAVTVYHGDCREVPASAIVAADVLMMDPPYTARTHENARTGKDGSSGGIFEIGFGPLSISLELLVNLFRPKRWALSFCEIEMLGDYRRACGDLWVRGGIWRRPDGAPQFSGDRPGQPGEGIAIWHAEGKKFWNGGGKHAYWEHGVVRGAERVHETQKPEALMLDLIADFTEPGELILDPFGGSGTTAVAAKRLGRRCVMVEMQEKHCASAVARLRQGSLFAPVQESFL